MQGTVLEGPNSNGMLAISWLESALNPVRLQVWGIRTGMYASKGDEYPSGEYLPTREWKEVATTEIIFFYYIGISNPSLSVGYNN